MLFLPVREAVEEIIGETLKASFRKRGQPCSDSLAPVLPPTLLWNLTGVSWFGPPATQLEGQKRSTRPGPLRLSLVSSNGSSLRGRGSHSRCFGIRASTQPLGREFAEKPSASGWDGIEFAVASRWMHGVIFFTQNMSRWQWDKRNLTFLPGIRS